MGKTEINDINDSKKIRKAIKKIYKNVERPKISK